MKIPGMTAVRYDATSTSVGVVEVRRPRPAAGQVLVRVGAVALHRREGEVDVGPDALRPDAAGHRILGGDVAGVVAAPGAGVEGWPLGRPVALRSAVHVGRGGHVLGRTHDGGLADYVVAPAAALVPLPVDLPMQIAARLPLLARAWSILRSEDVRPGEALGVWGAGALGLAVIGLARAIGGAPVIAADPSPSARAAAERRGADIVLDPHDAGFREALAAIGGLDVAVHSAPDPQAAVQAGTALTTEGRLVLAGPAGPIGQDDWWATGRRVVGLRRSRPDDLPTVLRLLTHGRLGDPWSDEVTIGLAAAAAALDTAVAGGEAVRAGVVVPAGSDG